MRKIVIIILSFFTTLLLASCSKDDVIYVGFAGFISGSANQVGVDSMYGAQFAIDEINENGGVNGKKLELIIKDDQADPDIAVQVDNELKDEGVVAIIGHGLSVVSDKIISNANENDILLISPTISTNAVTGIDDNFIRLIPSNDDQGEELALFVNTEPTKDVFIAYESNNIAYTGNLVSTFTERFEALGNSVNEDNIFSFESGVNESYLDIAQKIDESDVEVVLLLGSSYDVTTILQLTETIEDKFIYLPTWPSTKDLFKLGGDALHHVHAMSYLNPDSTNSTFINKNTAFNEKFGIDLSFSSVLSYEAVYVLYEALLRTNDYSTDSLKDAIIEIGTFDGMLEEITIDEYGDNKREMYWFLLDNTLKKFIEVKNESH